MGLRFAYPRTGTPPAAASAIEAMQTRLVHQRGLVYRYDTSGKPNGLPGREGTFLPCTFWLAQALAMAGRTECAREVFERAISHATTLICCPRK